MKLRTAHVAAFWLLVLSITSLTLTQMRAQTASDSTSAPSAGVIAPAVSGTGTTDFIPLWTNSTGALGNSVLFQLGTGATAKVGINTTAPAATLDVNGGVNLRGTVGLATTGTATAAAGKNSVPLDFTASAFNSSTARPSPKNSNGKLNLSAMTRPAPRQR